MSLIKTPISTLQELIAKKGAALPDYNMETTRNMESPDRFMCTVRCVGILAIGHAANKKEAKHNAARNALLKLGYNFDGPPTTNLSNHITDPPNKSMLLMSKLSTSSKVFQNHVGQLNEYVADKKFIAHPDYTYDVDFSSGLFVATCSLADMKAKGQGINKKEAKQHAAQMMLELLSENNNEASANLALLRKPMINIPCEEAIQKFKQLSISNLVRSQEVESISVPGIEVEDVDRLLTIEEMENILSEKGIQYTTMNIRKPK